MMKTGFWRDVQAVWPVLGQSFLYRFWGLVALSWFASACELLSIGALVPFLTVMAAPDFVAGHFESTALLTQVFDQLGRGVSDDHRLVVVFALV